jgi:hypothetical protein
MAGALIVRHHAPLGREVPARLPSLVVYELHYLFGKGKTLFGVVDDAKLYEQVGKAHDPESDAAVATAHLVYLWQRVVVHLDDVVEKADGGVDRLA